MADKKGKTTKNARRWTENKSEFFAEVLADPENYFFITLEKLHQKVPPVLKYLRISKIPLT